MRTQGKFDPQQALADHMTRAQGLRLRRLSEEAYQPKQFARDLSFDEAARGFRRSRPKSS